jgi:hypothetical protein
MTFKVKLVRSWEAVILSMIFIGSFSLMVGQIFSPRTNEAIYVIIGFPIFFGLLIAAAFLSTRTKTIEIDESIIKVGDSITIPIDQIKICRTGKSFLIDGLMIRMQSNKIYFFHSLVLFNSNLNFQLFKNALFNRSIDNHTVPVETKEEFFRRSKFLRYASRFLIVLLIATFIKSYLTGHKIDYIQFLYLSMISLSMVISTRK